jgi:hypothetical protein
MSKVKTILGCVLVLMMVTAPVLSVGAAAPAQTATIDGTVQSCVTATDNSTGNTIVVCEINLTGGGTKTIRLSVDDAMAKNLAVMVDGIVTIIATKGQGVSIDESMLLEDQCVMPEDASQPISKILAGYFCKDLGTSYEDIQTLHEDGFGFGEIAQACFMALKLDGTGDLCAEILFAKQNNDYSKLPLPDGVTVSNWGQLRKAVFGHGQKNSSNLGSVVSDSAKNGNGKNNNGNGHTNAEHGKPTK